MVSHRRLDQINNRRVDNMKKYEKPALEIIQLRVKENLANNGNTTVYNSMNSTTYAMEILGLGEVSG